MRRYVSRWLPVLLAVLVVVPAAQADALTTLYSADNGSRGTTFDIEVLNPNGIRIINFDVNLDNAGSTSRVAVYWKYGSAVGSENTAGAWYLLGVDTNVFSAGINNPTPVDPGTTLALLPGTYGFYLDVRTYPSAGILHTDGSPTVFSNADLAITTNTGQASPVFSSSIANQRWNGTIYYQVLYPVISTAVNQFADGQYVQQQNLYGVEGCDLEAFPSFLPPGVGLDAAHINPNGRTLFSVDHNGFASYPGGSIYLKQGLIYLYDQVTKEISLFPDTAGLQLNSLDALDRAPRFLFSVAQNQFAYGIYLKQQNVYQWSPGPGTVSLFLDLEAWGLNTLDCLYLPDGPADTIVFSTNVNQSLVTGAGSYYLERQKAYVLNTSTGEVTPYIDVEGLQTLDACTVAGVTLVAAPI